MVEAAKGKGHVAQLVYGCIAVPSPITALMLIMTVRPILLYDPTSPTAPFAAWDTESYKAIYALKKVACQYIWFHI